MNFLTETNNIYCKNQRKLHPLQRTPSLCRIFVESDDVEGCITLVDLAGSEHRIVPWPGMGWGWR